MMPPDQTIILQPCDRKRSLENSGDRARCPTRAIRRQEMKTLMAIAIALTALGMSEANMAIMTKETQS
jgi:hypothetical protein